MHGRDKLPNPVSLTELIIGKEECAAKEYSQYCLFESNQPVNTN